MWGIITSRMLHFLCFLIAVPLRYFTLTPQLTSKMYMFQDDREISYKEGVIGVRLPVRGRGQLFDRVSKEWSKIVETSSINVGPGTNHYLLRLGGEGGSRSDQLSPTDYKGGSLEYYKTSHGGVGGIR